MESKRKKKERGNEVKRRINRKSQMLGLRLVSKIFGVRHMSVRGKQKLDLVFQQSKERNKHNKLCHSYCPEK